MTDAATRGERPKVLVAMSGGVDSSVAAAMLLERGCDVVGVFMRLGSPGETIDELMTAEEAACPAPGGPGRIRIGHQGCCSINDAADARLVAAELGIPFYVCNFKKDFGRIIDYFVAEYESGRTPNPCVRCNDWLKFGKLHEYARQIGAGFVASGHYARVGRAEGAGGAPLLRRGLDRSKDQSYVLFGAPRERLAEMLLPIGEFASKAEVREEARRRGLPVFDKPDSQEICFVPDNDYAGLVERRGERARAAAAEGGAVLDPEGNVIGRHGGQHRFTIGQRKGVGVALGYPVYVVHKDPERNTVTLGPRAMLETVRAEVGEANWLVPQRGELDGAAYDLNEWTPVLARHRYNGEARPARARLMSGEDAGTPSGRGGRFEVEFEEPQAAVAPGQAMVLYDRRTGDVVLGGGWIRSAGPAPA